MSGLREERCLGEIMVTEINRIWAVGVGVTGQGGVLQGDARQAAECSAACSEPPQLSCRLGGRHTPVPPMPQ